MSHDSKWCEQVHHTIPGPWAMEQARTDTPFRKENAMPTALEHLHSTPLSANRTPPRVATSGSPLT